MQEDKDYPEMEEKETESENILVEEIGESENTVKFYQLVSWFYNYLMYLYNSFGFQMAGTNC